MTVTTLIFPVSNSAKTIGRNGLAFRACTSVRKSGKQSENKKDNYIGAFYDCKTFDKAVIDVIYKAAKNKKGIDITAYAEMNVWTDKEGKDRQNIVFNITGAAVHEKGEKNDDVIPF